MFRAHSWCWVETPRILQVPGPRGSLTAGGAVGELRRARWALWRVLSPPPQLPVLLARTVMDRNPSPPPPSCGQEDEEDLAGGDRIGSTVYSKHWLFGVLSGLIQVRRLAQAPSVPGEWMGCCRFAGADLLTCQNFAAHVLNSAFTS